MKNIIAGIIVMVFILPANAQTSKNLSGFEATMKGKILCINWSFSNDEDSRYWEVQGSIDGKEFTTIGLVMGAKPGTENEFSFKADSEKIKRGMQYYRVLQVQNDQMAVVYKATALKN